MKHTLVERVAIELHLNAVGGPFDTMAGWVKEIWKRKARRIIAMVRRNDRKEKGK